jgi:hypothetical protein
MFVRLSIFALVAACLAPMGAQAKSPADKFRGKIILSKHPFPTGFPSDKAFIRHMKKVDTKSFRFKERDNIPVEFMAFFSAPYQATEFTARIFDITERGKTHVVAEFPIYPNQRKTRILASGTLLDKGTFEEEHRYHMVVLVGMRGKALAETRFAIKADPKAKRKRGPTVVEF